MLAYIMYRNDFNWFNFLMVFISKIHFKKNWKSLKKLIIVLDQNTLGHKVYEGFKPCSNWTNIWELKFLHLVTLKKNSHLRIRKWMCEGMSSFPIIHSRIPRQVHRRKMFSLEKVPFRLFGFPFYLFILFFEL